MDLGSGGGVARSAARGRAGGACGGVAQRLFPLWSQCAAQGRFGEGKDQQAEARQENRSVEVFYSYRNFRHRLARELTGMYILQYYFYPEMCLLLRARQLWPHHRL